MLGGVKTWLEGDARVKNALHGRLRELLTRDHPDLQKLEAENVVLDAFEKNLHRAKATDRAAIHLEAELTRGLIRDLAEQRPPTAVASQHRSVIPPAPTPYYPHPAGLLPHVGWRDTYRARLSEWWLTGDAPLRVIVALGGFGKSTLAWIWLRRDVTGEERDASG
jgi:hypothetical protein